MIRSLQFVLSVLIIVAAAGCASPKVEQSSGNASEALAQEIALGEKILASIQRDNYTSFMDTLHRDFEKQISNKDFATSCKNMTKRFGKIVHYRYLTELETPAVKNLIWQVTFERQGSKQQPVKQDLLFRVVTGMLDGKPRVISIGFL